MPLKSLKLPPEGTLLGGPEAVAMRPEYPYGTRITLDEDALRLLNIGDLPEAGTVMGMKARVFVVEETTEMRDGKGKVRRLSLQIAEMDLVGLPENEQSMNAAQGQMVYMEDN